MLLRKEVLNNTQIANSNRFIVGSLLPDASSHNSNSYDKAHFEDWLYAGSRKGINWTIFENKYKRQLMNDSLYLG